MSDTRLLEYVRGEKVERVDRVNGVIYGVKCLGEESANPPPRNHLYPRSTREKAVRLFEGARVCINHPDRPTSASRPYGDGFGVIRKVREKGDGLYGDLHYNPRHPLAEQVAWDAENAPHALGLSINGDGRKRSQGGRMLVEEITFLESIDLVSRPATTNGLFESRRSTMRFTFKKLAERLQRHRPRAATTIREMAEAGLMPETMPQDTESGVMPDDGGELQGDEATRAIREGFRVAAMKVIEDEALSATDGLAKLKQILTARDKALSATGDSSSTSAEEARQGYPRRNLRENRVPETDQTPEARRARLADLRRGFPLR